MAGISFNPE
jgi:nucleoside-diphosphate-sugar epimerase